MALTVLGRVSMADRGWGRGDWNKCLKVGLRLPQMSDLFYHRCRVTTFKVQCAAHKKIVDIKNSKLRASSYKLYRWMCSYTSRTPTFSAKLKEISKVTGISQEAIINARREDRKSVV